MNNGVKFIFTFALGAAAGAVVTHFLIKEKYKQYANEEIEEVRNFYQEKFDDMDDCEDVDEDIPEEPKTNKQIIRSIIDENNYKKGGSESMHEDDETFDPEIISPDEYGDGELDYECESLVYYADGILADTWDNVVENVERMVGNDFANHFGEYEDDTVFVRNHEYKCDYEICRDERRYSEAVDVNPDLTGDE